MWKISRFTVVQNLAEHGRESHELVFNTHTGQCVVLAREVWDRIAGGLASTEPAGDEEVAAATERLAAGGILVDAGLDERAAYEERFEARRYNSRSLFPILAVTTSCNIGCTYCYEEGIVGKKMSRETVAGVVRWLERRILLDSVREIYPSLFGGEPLLYPKVLYELMDGVNALSARYGVECAFTSSSNGILLTDELARTLAEKGLRQIQISLDGPQRHHDARRIGKRGQPSFAESLRGIRTAVRWVPNVTVKVNFDRHNRDGVAELYDFLEAEGLAERVDVKLETIAFQVGSSTVHDRRMVIPPESPELADAYLELMVEARRRGLRVNRETAHTTPCMFTAQHGVIIGPDGSIYKCISLVGRPEFRVGTVFDDDYLADEYTRQMDNAKRTAECWEENCAYIPVCAGGCAFEAITRTGRYDVRFCTKKYLETWHYKRYLLRYDERIRELGIRPLTPEELRRTGISVAGDPAGAGRGALVQLTRKPRQRANLCGGAADAQP